MVRLLIYGYTTGVRSSRAIERKCVDDVAFRFLSADQAPDFRSIARFRRRHLDALADLFLQSLHLAQKLGMVKMSRVALDGTKLEANASKHKALSCGRLVDKEERVEAEIAELEAAAAALLANAEHVDTAEDARLGVDGKEVDLPAELSRREKRLARLQAARAQIEAEAADKARRHAEDKERRRQRRAGKSDERAVTDADEQAAANARPKPKAQADFTDPDSRIMKNSDGAYIQAYNAQAVVDEQHQVITAADVTTNASDALKYAIMLDQSAANTGTHPKQALVDAGYCSETNLEAAQDRQLSCGTDTFMATGRLGHDEQVPPAPRGRPGPPALSAASRADRISPRAADTGRAATTNLDEYDHSVSCRLLRHAPRACLTNDYPWTRGARGSRKPGQLRHGSARRACRTGSRSRGTA